MDGRSHAGTFVVADAYLVAYIVERSVNRAVATRISYGYFFFSDLSDSVFIVRASLKRATSRTAQLTVLLCQACHVTHRPAACE